MAFPEFLGLSEEPARSRIRAGASIRGSRRDAAGAVRKIPTERRLSTSSHRAHSGAFPSPVSHSMKHHLLSGYPGLFALGCLCILGFAPSAGRAQVSPALDRVSVSVGGFRSEPSIAARANTSIGTFNTGDFDTRAKTMPRIKADVLIFENHGLSLDYYQYKRDYSQSGTGRVNIAGNQVTATTDINLRATFDFGKVAYKWWLGSGDTVAGLGLGAAYYKVNASGSATATVAGATRRVDATYNEDAVAPLLELGLRHAITPDLRLVADASGVRKNGGSTRGSIYNAALGVEWFPVKNVGLLLAYDMSDITLKRRDEPEDRLRLKIHGPGAYLKVRF
jgi:hypothetical protein